MNRKKCETENKKIVEKYGFDSFITKSKNIKASNKMILIRVKSQKGGKINFCFFLLIF